MSTLLTITEVSEQTRLPEGTLRYYRSIGALGPKSFKLGRRVLYRQEDITNWIDDQWSKAGAL